MKKTVFALAFVSALLFAQNVFASSSPSLDGRAVVAEGGTFPKGFFAKTVGYLPGDSISVTNPMNSRQVNVLVIGSLDASEGVAILLSPESAEALSIKKDSNNLVKITKRNGTVDKVANGTAVITNPAKEVEEIEELENEIAEAEDASEEIEEEAAEIAIVEEKEEIFEEAEIAEAEETFDEIPEEEEVAVAEEETFDEIPEEEEVVVAEAEETFDEIPEEEEIVVAEEETLDEIPEETEIVIAEVEDSFDEIPEEKVELAEDFVEEEEEDEIVYERVEDYYIPEEVAKADEPLDEIPEEKIEFAGEMDDAEEEDEIVYERVDDDYIPDEHEEVAKADEPLDEIPEEEAASESVAEDVFIAESEIAEENAVEAEEDEYDAIVLVPAEANPPEVDENESVEENAAPVVAKSESAPKPVETPSASSPSKGDATYLKSAADLEARKYYVQIAVYSQSENVEQLDALYGGRYPLTILDEGARKTVLVGPLGMDEYGTVLERFKLFGFRDAFVRHAK